MAVLKARENSSDTFKPVSMMGVGNASQSQRGLMTAQDKVKLDTLVNLLVPVGVILTFANDIDPNDIYAGTTWEKIEGRFLLGSSNDYALGDTGGEAEHTLTEQEMPKHDGHLNNYYQGTYKGFLSVSAMTSYSSTRAWVSPSGGEIFPASHSSGNSQAHNNMPPYEVVNYWKRTA